MKYFFFFIHVFLVGLICTGCSSTAPVPQNVSIQKTLGDTSRVSSDWIGVYEGVTPCADCEGIKTRLSLAKEGFFKLELEYLGKSNRVFMEQGTFHWDDLGGKIALEGLQSGVLWYSVGENKLDMLESNEKLIATQTGSYELKKVSTTAEVSQAEQLQEIYWKLIGIKGKAVVIKSSEREPYIMLKIENNRLQGFSGCNLLMGSYELKVGNRIQFSKMASTMMACPHLADESAFLKVLEEVDSYTIKEGVLMLHKVHMAPLATFEAVYLR